MPLHSTFTSASINGYTSFGVGNYEPADVLTASNAGPNDFFGFQTAMDNNGVYLAIGAIGQATSGDQGSVYVFFRSGTTWTQQAELTPPVTTLNWGQCLTMSAGGDYLVITDSTLYRADIYNRTGTSWTLQDTVQPSSGTSGEDFGRWRYSAAINAAGDYLVIGSPGHNSDRGRISIFTRSGSTWSLQQTITNTLPGQVGDEWGYSVAINAAGDFILFSAPGEDTGATNGGYIRGWQRSGSTWSSFTSFATSNIGANDRIGQGMVLSKDDEILVITSGNNINSTPSSIYTFDKSGAFNYYNEVAQLGPAFSYTDTFGYTIAVNNDGTEILVGAGDQVTANTSAVFRFSGSNPGGTGWVWNQTQKITVENQTIYFGTGSGIEINGTSTEVMALGDFFSDYSGNSAAGAMYIFYT